MRKKSIHWGILGLGKIAAKFAHDLALVEEGQLQALASRSKEKAERFAKEYHTRRSYDTYLELVQDPAVDVVYIATPHVFHFEHAMLCLKHGKSVLCEKPLGMNSQQVETLIREAKESGLFLMEGMWTRFIPATQKLLELITTGEIGEVTRVEADFGFKSHTDPEGRLYNKALGGGSLLDIGIYPVYLAQVLLGKPETMDAEAQFTTTGVDGLCEVKAQYFNGASALLRSSLLEDTPTEARVIGTKGEILVHSRFHHSEQLTLLKEDGTKQEYHLPYRGLGYSHEIEEVHRGLKEGLLQTELHPWQASLDTMETLDRIRHVIGLQYE